jgi:hypothetical protein
MQEAITRLVGRNGLGADFAEDRGESLILCGRADKTFDSRATATAQRIECCWWDEKTVHHSACSFPPRSCRYLFESEGGQHEVSRMMRELKLDAVARKDIGTIAVWAENRSVRTGALHQLQLLVQRQQYSAERDRQDATIQSLQDQLRRTQREYERLETSFAAQEEELLRVQLEYSKIDASNPQ